MLRYGGCLIGGGRVRMGDESSGGWGMGIGKGGWKTETVSGVRSRGWCWR